MPEMRPMKRSPHVLESTTSISRSRSPTSNYTLKFTFRTTVADTHIASTESILSQMQLALSLRRGYLYGNFTGFIYRKLLPFAVNDDHWYTILFSNINKVSFTSFTLPSLNFLKIALKFSCLNGWFKKVELNDL